MEHFPQLPDGTVVCHQTRGENPWSKELSLLPPSGKCRIPPTYFPSRWINNNKQQTSKRITNNNNANTNNKQERTNDSLKTMTGFQNRKRIGICPNAGKLRASVPHVYSYGYLCSCYMHIFGNQKNTSKKKPHQTIDQLYTACSPKDQTIKNGKCKQQI